MRHSHYYRSRISGEVYVFEEDQIDTDIALSIMTEYDLAPMGESDIATHFEPLPVSVQEEDLAELVRYRIGEVDGYATNPLLWNDTSSEDMQTLSEYRQSLVDIRELDKIPEDIVWPQRPECLERL